MRLLSDLCYFLVIVFMCLMGAYRGDPEMLDHWIVWITLPLITIAVIALNYMCKEDV